MTTKTLSPLGKISLELNDRAAWHLEKINDYSKTSRNYKYHAHMRKEVLKAMTALDNARFALPSDFAEPKELKGF
jgi:hypothetical protein